MDTELFPPELQKLIVKGYEAVHEDDPWRLVLVMANADRHYKTSGTEAEIKAMAEEGNKLIAACTQTDAALCVANPEEIDMKQLQLSLVTKDSTLVVKTEENPRAGADVVLISHAAKDDMRSHMLAEHIHVPHLRVPPVRLEREKAPDIGMMAGLASIFGSSIGGGLPDDMSIMMPRMRLPAVKYDPELLKNPLDPALQAKLERELVAKGDAKRARREARREADRERTRKQRAGLNPQLA